MAVLEFIFRDFCTFVGACILLVIVFSGLEAVAAQVARWGRGRRRG